VPNKNQYIKQRYFASNSMLKLYFTAITVFMCCSHKILFSLLLCQKFSLTFFTVKIFLKFFQFFSHLGNPVNKHYRIVTIQLMYTLIIKAMHQKIVKFFWTKFQVKSQRIIHYMYYMYIKFLFSNQSLDYKLWPQAVLAYRMSSVAINFCLFY
jgi:hypothetical protein